GSPSRADPLPAPSWPAPSGPPAEDHRGRLQDSLLETVHTGGMDLTLVTVLFLGVAVLVAIGILAVVALPRLRRREEPERAEASVREDQRHRSRTSREQ